MSNRPSDFFGISPKSVLNKPFMHVQDQKAYNVNGGTSIADAWTTRDLNTVIHNDIQGASLAANAVSLPAGTYYVEGAYLFTSPSITQAVGIAGIFKDGVKTLQGLSTAPYNLNNTVPTAVSGVITLSQSGVVDLRYYIGAAQATNGLGVSNNAGSIVDPTIPSIYSDLKIWQLDRSLEIAPKAVNSGLQTVPSLDTTGNIMGFDISKTAANQVTVTKGSCLDSTLEVPMALTADTALAIPAVANTIYHIFLVRLVADGTFTVKAYTSEAAVASDTLVDKWRWLGFWRTNGSAECVAGKMRDDCLIFTDRVEIATIATTTYSAVDLSTFLPGSRIKSLSLAVKSNATIYPEMSLDGGTTINFDAYTNNVIDAAYLGEFPYQDTIHMLVNTGSVIVMLSTMKLRR